MLRKRMFSISLVLVLLLGCLFIPSSANGANGDWQLVWNDEFNGTAGSGVDTNKWVYETGGGGWGNGELENYTNRTDNVYLEQDPGNTDNRFLVIKAIREAYGGSQYTSGRIKTQGKFSLQYGKIEMRAKLPYGQGIWPAFWMLGNDIVPTGWPDCGEVDIMEFVGSTPSKVYGTLHGPGYSGGGGLGAWHDYPAGFSDSFHTYSVEWEPNVFRWYFDGQLFQTRTVEDLAGRQWVFSHNFFLLLNCAVGGAWPGNPDASTVFPQKYTVDYVRVYQREGGVYPSPTQRYIATMRSLSSNQFACADNYNGMRLAADRAVASTWEMFEQKDLGDGNIALIALMGYKYVSAGAGGNSQLIADKETVGPSETFRLVSNSDGTKSLQCAANGKYVSVNAAKAMFASATSIGTAEKFTFAYTGNPPSQVETPSITPGGGNYTAAQTVSISCATSGATIKYTVDGSTPNPNSATYSAPISISANTTLKAYAIKSGLTDSAVNTQVYTFSTPQVATPVFNPSGGSYTSAQTVAITCATSEATIKYTVDGSTPNPNSATYTAPISIASDTTLKAYAIKSGLTDSAVNTQVYTFSAPQVATPVFNPPGGNYASAQTVAITCATSGATIKYTTDGSAPNSNSAAYTAPIEISSNTTLKAYAFLQGMSDSAVASAAYTFGSYLEPAVWYLFNTPVSGVTPAGQNLQTAKTSVTGWQPTKAITTTAGYWYSPSLNGSYNAGNWSFVLWTNSPASSSTVQVSLYKVNPDGGGAVQIGASQSLDVKTTGTGNHPSTFTFSGVPSVSLSNQLLMVKIEKTAGVDCTMAYNSNDFPSRLLTP